MNFENYRKEEMRLEVLCLLNELPSYRGNSSTLYSHLIRRGLSFSRDQVKTELYWLKEQGYIAVELDEDVMVVKLLPRGQDVVLGYAKVPGIQRPSV